MSGTIDRALRRTRPMRPSLYSTQGSAPRGESIVIRRGIPTPVTPIQDDAEQSGVVALALGAVGFVLVGIGLGLCLSPWILSGICQ